MSDVAKNEVAKKVVYGELVKKVSAIQTTDADYDIKIVKTEKIMIKIRSILLLKNLNS